MKKLTYLIIPLFLMICHCNQNKDGFTGVVQSGTTQNKEGSLKTGTYTIRTIYNDEIDTTIKKEIYNKHQQLISAIINKDIHELKSVMASEFKEVDFEYLIKSGGHFENNKLNTLCEYYSTVESTGDVSYPILNDRETPFIINSVKVKNNEIFNLFQTNENNAIQFLYHSMYIKEDQSWKNKKFWVGLYAIENRNGFEWHRIAQDSFLNANSFIAYFSSIISTRLLLPTPYLQYRNRNEKLKINNEIKNTSSKQIIEFSKKYEIVGFDYVLYSDTSFPLVRYVTNLKDANKAETEFETKALFQELSSNYEHIQDYFKVCGFQVFKKKPVDSEITIPPRSAIIEITTNSI